MNTLLLTISRQANGDLTASTPEGTRVATPLAGTTPSVEAPIASIGTSKVTGGPQKMSYAGAAISAVEKATDFHLEFRMNNETLPMDMTIYGALHQYEMRQSQDGSQPNPHAVWNGSYTVTYKKIPGKRPAAGNSQTIYNTISDIGHRTCQGSCHDGDRYCCWFTS